MALKIATGGRVGQAEGIVDFWILEKRRIIADDEATARKRLKLTPNQEVISVGERPFAFAMGKLPTLAEVHRQMGSCIVYPNPPVKSEEIKRIPRRPDPPQTTWLKRLRNRRFHLLNSGPKSAWRTALFSGVAAGAAVLAVYYWTAHRWGWAVYSTLLAGGLAIRSYRSKATEPRLISYKVNSNGDTAYAQWRYSIPEGVKSITFHAPQFPKGDLNYMSSVAPSWVNPKESVQ